MRAEVRSPEKSASLVSDPVETPQPGNPYSKISKEDIELAYKWFPQSPLAFNAVTFLAAVASGIDPLENLKTAFIYLDLEIQARGGWDK